MAATVHSSTATIEVKAPAQRTHRMSHSARNHKGRCSHGPGASGINQPVSTIKAAVIQRNTYTPNSGTHGCLPGRGMWPPVCQGRWRPGPGRHVSSNSSCVGRPAVLCAPGVFVRSCCWWSSGVVGSGAGRAGRGGSGGGTVRAQSARHCARPATPPGSIGRRAVAWRAVTWTAAFAAPPVA